MIRYLADSGNFGGDGEWYGHMGRMMSPYLDFGNPVLFLAHWILGFATWILFIILMVGLIRWVWKKGDDQKKK